MYLSYFVVYLKPSGLRSTTGEIMEYDQDKVDEVALALLALTMFKNYGVTRAWKGLDWDILDRLETKGWIAQARTKAKSVILTEEGQQLAEAFFKKHFSQ